MNATTVTGAPLAHLFVNVAGGWAAAPLAPMAYALAGGATPVRVARPETPPADGEAVLAPLAGASRWALLTRANTGVTVNGRAVAAGLHVLQNRDEIRVRDSRLFFSSERLIHRAHLPDLGRPVRCARCSTPIEVSCLSVNCPNCSSWYHETPEWPCWSYAPTCRQCPQRTDAEAFSWMPARY